MEIKIKCLVTGGAGFIGSHLCELLIKTGHTVVAIDNLAIGKISNLKLLEKSKSFEFFRSDITDINEISSKFTGIDWVFHLAGLAEIVPSIEHPDNYFKANIIGTYNIAKLACEKKVKKILYAASSSCYGIPRSFPTNESSKCDPKYPYALTKYLGEQILLHWSSVYNIPAISLRLFNVYGPRARTSGTYGAVFGVFLAQKLAGKPFTVVGDGTQTRDFTYVTDVCRAFLAAAESRVKNEIFNVGSGETYQVNKLVELLNGPVVYIPKRPAEPDCTFADITKIQEYLGWRPEVSLNEGVNIMLGRINEWKDAPLWDDEKISQATKSWFKYLSNNGGKEDDEKNPK